MSAGVIGVARVRRGRELDGRGGEMECVCSLIDVLAFWTGTIGIESIREDIGRLAVF